MKTSNVNSNNNHKKEYEDFVESMKRLREYKTIKEYFRQKKEQMYHQ